MRHIRLLTTAAIAAAVSFSLSRTAAAQGQDWFVPGQQRSGQPSQALRPGAGRPSARSQPAPVGAPVPLPPAAAPEEEPAAPVQVQLPPAPDVPALPKAASPPAAVVGVLGLADISRASTAAQEVDKVLNQRMTKLHDDAQKEQATWRDIQQQLAAQRTGLGAEQIRAKERDLQERVTNAQRQFRDRNRVIQEAAQYARAQIERTLRQVVIQVSESRGINLVLHQEQVVLNYPAFDITQPVVEQLNKVLPAVIIPADGIAVSKMPGAVPVAQAQPAAPAAPAAAQAPASAAAPAAAAPAPAAAAPPGPPSSPPKRP